jgi:uncharacterized membrane protein YphA (DoxX/SURF4 family)
VFYHLAAAAAAAALLLLLLLLLAVFLVDNYSQTVTIISEARNAFQKLILLVMRSLLLCTI